MDPTVPDNSAGDAALLSRAADGDPDARRQLFELHREAAFRVALRVTRREADALDVVQDAFIKAFESLADFQRESGFKTWLLRIVTNRALDLVRARRVRLAVSIEGGDEEAPQIPIPDSDAGPASVLMDRELGDRIGKAIDALPLEQRTVFSLFALGELSYAEIAATLSIPIGTVMSRLFNARKRLQHALSDVGHTEGTRKRGPPIRRE
jgi:RNA polymerase sigma-70 factor (ECF subfamily)